MHNRPAADKFMKAVRDLRARNASKEKCKGAAEVLYPSGSAAASSVKSARSRFIRACVASDESFRRARNAYDSGANIVDIVAALDKATFAGAPKGNVNARGKKRDFSLTRINGMWRTMSREKQNEFLRTHNLKRTL